MLSKSGRPPLSRASAFTPSSLARSLFKKRWIIVVIFIIAAACGTIFVLTLKPVFKAEALILVESQKIPENYVAATVQTAIEARLESLKEQVLSNERLWELISTYDLYRNIRPRRTRDELLAQMRDDVVISLERSWSGSRPAAFRVSYEALSPDVAAQVTNRVSRFFIEENLTQRSQEAAATSHFLDSELAEAKQRLEEQEARLSSFKVSNIGELPEQAASLLSTIGQGRTELIGIQEATARAHQNILVLQSSVSSAEESLRALQTPARSPQVRTMVAGEPKKNPEQALEADLKVLRTRYRDAHPDVQRLERELSALRERGVASPAAPDHSEVSRVAEPEAGSDETTDSLRLNARLTLENLKTQIVITEHEIGDLEARRKQILIDLDQGQQHLQRVPVHEQELSAITRDYDTSRANYQSLLRKKMEADVAADMERSQKAERFILLNAARPPDKPERPKKPLLLVVVAAVSLVFSVLCGLALEFRGNVVLGEWELPKRVPILGYIPAMPVSEGQGFCTD